MVSMVWQKKLCNLNVWLFTAVLLSYMQWLTKAEHIFCGSRTSMTRIVGGTEAPVNSWPWQVMLRHTHGSQFCGGSLVDPYWVVTAAHCLPGKTASSIKIRLGAHYRTNGSLGTEQDIGVAEIIMHEYYDTPLSNSNDIALLKLASPADLGEGVGLVCLPDTGYQLPFDNINKKCWITGWGILSSGGASPNTLQQASVPLVSKQRCTSAHPGDIDDSMLCAGLYEAGVDTCQGDSGGPLVCEFNGTWYLEGVVSWGYGCAQANTYGVYANVRNLTSWLTTNMYAIVAPPSVSPQNQSSSALVSCSFDDGLCLGWSQSNSDVFDWTLNSGSTPSLSTGPSSDLSRTGKYVYIEATPQSYGDNAKLQFAVPGSNSSACLKFFYHMYGSDMGTLNVFNGNSTIFTKSGDQGDHWKSVTRTVNLSDVLTFEGIVGGLNQSDIAIDNVTVSEGDCQDSASCNFDSKLCDGWRQSNTDIFDWTRHTGSTQSSNTGPDYDHTSGSGYYMYIETSYPRVAGDNAKLEFSVPGDGEPSCLKFYYHMYGDTMGTINVFSGTVMVFSATGNHGNHWIKAEITTRLNNTITFEGIAGTSYTGDLAIDDVSVTNGSCQGHTATPMLSTTSTFAPPLPSVSMTFAPSTDKPSMSSISTTSSTPNPSSSSPDYSPTTKTFKPDTSKSPLSPKTPSSEEKQESVVLEVRDLDIRKWNEQMENKFKRKVARAATDYCAVEGIRCQFTPTSSRQKRSSNNMVFTSDMVHILSGYPKQSLKNPVIALLAFYLQLPQGFSNNIVNRDVLIEIVESDKSSIEESMGGTILSVQPLPITDTSGVKEDKKSKPTSVIIGASVGGVLLLVIIAASVFGCKKSSRFNNRRAKKKDGNNCINNAYINNAYNIGSEEQDIEMKSDGFTFSSGNVPDQNLEKHNCAAINDQPVSANQSGVILKFPEALAEKNSEVVASFSYQPLDSGPKFSEASPGKNSEGNATSIYQQLKNDPKVSEA
ncbi:hypothetical protein ACROYT_G000125 [Oculina patagonica]